MNDKLDIAYLTKLANIEVEPAQVKILTHELESILVLIDQLQAVDTHDVTPLLHPLDSTQPLRQDEVNEPNQQQALLNNAPQTADGLFIVPQFVETE